jgi:hypothetical protein
MTGAPRLPQKIVAAVVVAQARGLTGGKPW